MTRRSSVKWPTTKNIMQGTESESWPNKRDIVQRTSEFSKPIVYGRRAGLMVSALDSGSRGPRGSTLVGDIVLCFWARNFTLTCTVPLSTQVYKWVPATLLLLLLLLLLIFYFILSISVDLKLLTILYEHTAHNS